MAGTLLRPAEAHVRILGHYEAFSISANHANLKFANHQTAECTDTLQVTRVHRGITTADFFAEVVLPWLSNVYSGQSYTILVNGPRDSGRSVTLYGNPKLREKGLIELTADYLCSSSAAHHAAVTFSHFLVQEERITDCDQDPSDVSQCEVLEFPSPVGVVATPTMTLLENPQQAVKIIASRSPTSSFFTQFHVYSQSGTGSVSTRTSMGVLTFVDVCAFSVEGSQPKDLSALQCAVQCAGEGSDLQGALRQSRLTQLLESSLNSYSSLISLTTVTGNAELYYETKAALMFAQSVTKIQKVLLLVQLQNPKWIYDVAEHFEQLRHMRSVLFANRYAAGVMDFFRSAQKLILSSSASGEDAFDGVLSEARKARVRIAQQIEECCRPLRDELAATTATTQHFTQEAALFSATGAMGEQEVGFLEGRIRDLQERLDALEQEGAETNNRLNDELLAVKREDTLHRSELVQYDRLVEDAAQSQEEHEYAVASAAAAYRTYLKELRVAPLLQERYLKKRRLEEQLSTASSLAQSVTDHHRQARERQKLHSRVTFMEQQVSALRSRSCSQSNAVEALSATGAVPLTARHYMDPHKMGDPAMQGSTLGREGAVPRHHHHHHHQGKERHPRRKRDGSENATIASLYL